MISEVLTVYNTMYCILPVNSRGYYKFQVWQLTEICISRLCVRHKFMVFNLVLCGDHPSAVTI